MRAMRAAATGREAPGSPSRVRLRPQDSFDLIRLLARSQSDARKAISELIQNSLDAEASRVEITWCNEQRLRCLHIRDDGEGVFPQLDRADALRKIAQTIGRSHKGNLSPAERHAQMVQGKYGIGLLGFWCVARTMEIRSRVGGGEVWVLRLVEDRPEAEVFRSRSQRLSDEPTFTEITLRDIKESVQRQVRPPRLQAYLANELRGQLLQRGVEIRIHDGIARGRAPKEFVVRPRPYLGIPLEGFGALRVPAHEDARLELYYVPPDEERHGIVSLACGGTTVLDDISAVDPTDPAGGAREPWASGRVEGVVDFPELQVAPGTRRGFVPDEAALAFLIALETLERALAQRLVEEENQRAQQRREQVAREIRRAFAPVARRLPHYDLLNVSAGARAGTPTREAPTGAALDDALAGARTDDEGAAGPEEAGADDDLRAFPLGEAPQKPPEEPVDESSLFPPGPLVNLRIIPPRTRLAPSAQRRLRARAEDADGRAPLGELTFSWSLEGPGGLVPDGATALYLAPDQEVDARVFAVARQGGLQAGAEATILVRESAGAGGLAAGIPEPRPVNAPSEGWRSRIVGNIWQYNEGHPDYLAVASIEQRRLRYLIHLFAKEIVLRNFGSPADGELLERMVEVLTHLGPRDR
jgi:hypothetical protein